MAIIEPEFMELTNRLDVQAFWDENQLYGDFTTQKPRCATAFSLDDHWLFEFMNVPSHCVTAETKPTGMNCTARSTRPPKYM